MFHRMGARLRWSGHGHFVEYRLRWDCCSFNCCHSIRRILLWSRGSYWKTVCVCISLLVRLTLALPLIFHRTMSSFGKACEAIKYEVMTLVIAFVTLLIMYKYLSKTEIPVVTMSQPVENLVNESNFSIALRDLSDRQDDVVAMDVCINCPDDCITDNRYRS